MKTRRLILLLTTPAMIATLVGCSGISSNTPASRAASIAVLSGSGQSTFVGAAFSARLLATVTTGGSPMSGVAVTFTAPASGASGTFAGGVNTAMTDDRGVAASPVFTANAMIGNYAVTAAVPGASIPASFNLANTAAPVSVIVNPPPPTSMLIGTTTTLTAVVSNDSTNSGVTWTCLPTNVCGSFNPTTSTGSTATTTYTAPTAIPSGGSVIVTATSIKDSTQSATATITISSPPPISVSFQPTPASMATGTTTTLIAVVANDSTNSGVTWTCLPANACGSFNPTTSTGSTATTTYTAPTAIPSGDTVLVTATAVQNPSASASANITITIAGAISVTLNPAPPPILKPGATTTLTALVVGDATNAGVTWSCTPLKACGSFNPSTSAGSTATTSYTAPAAIPRGSWVTVTATAVKSVSSSASANIAITTSALPDGTYVFSLTHASTTSASGQSGYFVAGAFQVASGAITGGEQDFSNINGIFGSDLINGAGSGISTTADRNLQITLKTCNGTDCSTTDTNVGVVGVETFNGTLVSASRALITEFDSSTTGSGSLDRQVANVLAPAQGYAFFTSGFDPNFFFAGIGGVINVDGTASGGAIAISGAGSVFDINVLNLFPPMQNQSFAASSVTTPDQFGRVTFALNPSAASTISPISLIGYIVDSSRIYLVETADTFRGCCGSMGGVALGQGSNTGKFSSASVFGSSFVFGTSGSDNSGFLQEAGVLTANPGSTVSGTLSSNDLNVTGTQSFTGGVLTVDATGRVTLTNLTANAIILQLYLTGSGTGTVVSMDNNTDVVSGLIFRQTAGASFTGTYGMNASGFDLANRLEFEDVGPVSANPRTGTGSLVATHTIDENFMTSTPLATPTPGLSISGAFTPFATGIFTGTITGLDIDSQNANIDNFTYYIVDTTKVLAIETDTNQLMLTYFELQQ